MQESDEEELDNPSSSNSAESTDAPGAGGRRAPRLSLALMAQSWRGDGKVGPKKKGDFVNAHFGLDDSDSEAEDDVGMGGRALAPGTPGADSKAQPSTRADGDEG